MTITNDIRYIGVNDHQVDLFEGQYVVPTVCPIILMPLWMRKLP